MYVVIHWSEGNKLGATPLNKASSSSSNSHQLPQLEVRHWTHLLPRDFVCFELAQVFCVLAPPLWIHRTAMPCTENCFLAILTASAFYSLATSCSMVIPEPWRRWVINGHLELRIHYYFMHCVQWQVSGLIAIYDKNKCLWWGLRKELTYGYNSKSVGVSLTYAYLAEKNRSNGFSLECMLCLIKGSWLW